MNEDYTICMYERLSNEDFDLGREKEESCSITAQRALIQNFIEEKEEFAGCNVIERYDDGLSGRYFDNRPGFVDMIDLAKKGKIQCIIIKDFSRFGRDYVETGDYIEQIFPFLGVRFISINDKYDSARDEASLDVAFRNLIYDSYSRDLSVKELQIHKMMSLQGKFLGAQVVYGYVRDPNDKFKLLLDPPAAAVVKNIFEWRLSGMKVGDIARKLNEEHVPSRNLYRIQKGDTVLQKNNLEFQQWTYHGVTDVLNNEIYTGNMVSHKVTINRQNGKQIMRPESEWIRVKGTHEAIISEEDFQEVQAMRKKAPVRTKHPKLRCRCGVCGRRLHRAWYKYIRCEVGSTYNDDRRHSVEMREKDFDRLVLQELKRKLSGVLEEAELSVKKSHKGSSIDSKLMVLEEAVGRMEQKKKILFEDLADRKIERDVFLEKKAALDRELQNYKEKKAELLAAREVEEQGREKAEEISSILDATEMTEEMWDEFVRDVKMYPDKRIEIEWKFTE